MDKHIKKNNELTRMIKKYLNIVKAIYNENYSKNATNEQKEFEQDIDAILSVDDTLNAEFHDWVDDLKNFDTGDNKGISEKLFDLKHNLLDLQVKIIIRKQSRAKKDPNMLRIIDLLNKKVRLIKQIMKLSLEEENQIFVPENDDASKITYHQMDLLPNHEKYIRR